jgi:hypothetical protein
VDLWSDLRGMTKSELVSALAKITAAPAKKRVAKTAKQKKVSKRPKANTSPAARIVALAMDAGVSDRDLQRRLVEVLIERGYSASDIPNVVGLSLEVWLDELMAGVPSSEVIEAATRLLPQQ